MEEIENCLNSWHIKRPPPPEWEIEAIPRENPKYFGKVDIYYYEPGTKRKFRSYKKAWEQYRETLQLFDLSGTHSSTASEKSKKREYDGEFEKLDPKRIEWVREIFTENRTNLIDVFK